MCGGYLSLFWPKTRGFAPDNDIGKARVPPREPSLFPSGFPLLCPSTRFPELALDFPPSVCR